MASWAVSKPAYIYRSSSHLLQNSLFLLGQREPSSRSSVLDRNNMKRVRDNECQVSMGEDIGETSNSVYECDHVPFEPFIRCGMLKLVEGGKLHGQVKEIFLLPLDQYANNTKIIAIYKNSLTGSAMKARSKAFWDFKGSVRLKNGGDVNLKNVWYGASKEEISQVLSCGFNRCSKPSADDVANGVGLYLSTSQALLNCITSLTPDEHGLRHVLLCSAIMGNMEAIPAGSQQSCSSSTAFDSGVDDLEEPRRCIFWASNRNSQVFPCFIISFKAPNFRTWATNQLACAPICSSRKLSLNFVFFILLRYLNPSKATMMRKHLDDFYKRKINLCQMIQHLSLILGDDVLLIEVIKATGIKRTTKGPSTCRGWSSFKC